MDDPAQLLTEARAAAARVGDQVADRDDLVQETLLRVWRRMQARGESAAPGALIRTTLRNVRIDRWRRQRRMTGEVPALAGDRGPLDDVATAELRGLLRRAMATLPEPQREVVRLRIYEHMKFREIAVMQNVPLNTVLGRMHLALQKLRATLVAHVGEPTDA